MKPDPMTDMLLAMAEKDYTAVRKMAGDAEFADEVFGFHAQQVVEKAAKAMLAAKNIKFERKHDLEPLFDILEENTCIQPQEFGGLIDLTDFAVQYRYQAFDEIEAGLDRRAIADEVRRFLDHAHNMIRHTAQD
jgi:HEPN domain-containing protein